MDWLQNMYIKGSDIKTAKDIYPQVFAIAELYKQKKYNIVDDIIKNLQVVKLSTVSLVSILRSCWVARGKLPSYNLAKKNIIIELEERNEDINSLLKGLLS